MDANTWIGLASLALAIMSTMIGAAVYVVRAIGEAKAAGPDAVLAHERSCANHEHNTGLRLQPVQRVEP